MHRGILSNCFMGGLRPIRSNYGSSRLHSLVCFTRSRLLTECDRPGFSTLHTWHGRHIWRGTELWAKIFLVRGNSQTNPARLALPLLGLNWRLQWARFLLMPSSLCKKERSFSESWAFLCW